MAWFSSGGFPAGNAAAATCYTAHEPCAGKLFAQLLWYLRKAPARAIGIDMTFAGRDSDPESDPLFRQQLAEANDTVLACCGEERPKDARSVSIVLSSQGSNMNRRTFIQLAPAAVVAARSTASAWPANAALQRPAQSAQNAKSTPRAIKRFGDARDWFFQKRFGMFVHWGIYSIPGWHEQHQWRARVPRAEYVKLASQWNPVKFSPDAWLDLMQEVGMKYICFTTKHHDGFCLWDTKQTAFNTMNTPYRRDIVKMLADACHRRGVPLCLYYSIADWNQPNYPNEGRHHELPPQAGDQPDWMRYLEFLKAQVRELCSNYGELHGFWWDMNVPKHVDPSINAMIRKLQPRAVINNRGFDDGDFGTPERDYDNAAAQAAAFERPTEACQSVGMESWGFRKDEDYYSDRHLMRSIDRYLVRDANYLLNVGPTPQGVIPAQSAAILKRIGKWYQAVKESLEGVEMASQFSSNREVMLTRRDRTLYVHLNAEPRGDGVKLKPINARPRRAVLLNDGRPITFAVDLVPSEHMEQKPYLRLSHLPVDELPNTVLVAKLEFDRPLEEIASGTPPLGYAPEMQK